MMTSLTFRVSSTVRNWRTGFPLLVRYSAVTEPQCFWSGLTLRSVCKKTFSNLAAFGSPAL